MSASEITQTLHHEISNNPQVLPSQLEGVYNSTSNNVPIRLAMMVPETVRASIRDNHQKALAEGGLQAALTGGLYAPFVDMMTLAITGTIDADDNFDLTIVGDLSNEKAAAKGEVAMGMITGLIGGFLPAPEEGESTFNPAQALKSRADGRFLILEMKLPKEELNQ